MKNCTIETVKAKLVGKDIIICNNLIVDNNPNHYTVYVKKRKIVDIIDFTLTEYGWPEFNIVLSDDDVISCGFNVLGFTYDHKKANYRGFSVETEIYVNGIDVENGVGRYYLDEDRQLFFNYKREWVTVNDKKIWYYDHIKAGEYGINVSIDDYCKAFDCEYLMW